MYHVCLSPEKFFLDLQDPPPLTYKRGEILTLPIKRPFETVEITPELAKKISPVEVKAGCMVSMVTAALNIKDNKYTLEVPFYNTCTYISCFYELCWCVCVCVIFFKIQILYSILSCCQMGICLERRGEQTAA